MSKREFVRTKNYTAMFELLSTLVNLKESSERIGLGYGEPGLGKTIGLEKLAYVFDAVFIRINDSWTAASSMTALADALGLHTKGSTAAVVRRIVDSLISEPRAIIVDEIDRALAKDKMGVLENLRDIHDQAKVPLLLVGMTACHARLQRHKHLYSRIVYIEHFPGTTEEDIKKFINMCGTGDDTSFKPIKIKDDLKKYLCGLCRDIRCVTVRLERIELWCQLNDALEMDLKTYRIANIERKKNASIQK